MPHVMVFKYIFLHEKGLQVAKELRVSAGSISN